MTSPVSSSLSHSRHYSKNSQIIDKGPLVLLEMTLRFYVIWAKLSIVCKGFVKDVAVPYKSIIDGKTFKIEASKAFNMDGNKIACDLNTSTCLEKGSVILSLNLAWDPNNLRKTFLSWHCLLIFLI